MIKSEGGHQCPHCPLPLQNYSHGKFQSSKPLFKKNASPPPMSPSSSLYSKPSKPRHRNNNAKEVLVQPAHTRNVGRISIITPPALLPPILKVSKPPLFQTNSSLSKKEN